jgi:ESCRT-II complex subunit VPS25
MWWSISKLFFTIEHAEWENKEKLRCIIWWRRPEEWGQLIYDWACAHGLLQTICTLYEIVQGDLSKNTEFYGIDINIVYLSFLSLEKKGKVKMIKNPSSPMEEYGVKFL